MVQEELDFMEPPPGPFSPGPAHPPYNR
jgi:hypothetical protein